MIKVCHMTSVHPPEDVRIFHKECVSLAKAGYETYLVQRGESYEKEGVHIVGVGAPPKGRIQRMTNFARSVYQKALEIDADIYHFHDPELLPYGLKLKKRGKKVIFDSHEIYAIQISQKSYLPRWVIRLITCCYICYEKHVVKQLDAVVVPGLRGDRLFFDGKAKKLVIVDNTAKLDELYDHYCPEITRNTRQVCYVGSLTQARGITLSIKAVYAAQCRLFLAGKFVPAGYEESLRAMPEFSCVEYQGELDRTGVQDLLNRSSIGLCLMSAGLQFQVNSNLNVKTYEYMAMGMPVILSCNPYNRTILDQWKFGICVNPNNEKEVTDAICYLLNHPEEARQMGENGRRAIKEKFNWGVEEKKLLALYEEVLSDGCR